MLEDCGRRTGRLELILGARLHHIGNRALGLDLALHNIHIQHATRANQHQNLAMPKCNSAFNQLDIPAAATQVNEQQHQKRLNSHRPTSPTSTAAAINNKPSAGPQTQLRLPPNRTNLPISNRFNHSIPHWPRIITRRYPRASLIYQR